MCDTWRSGMRQLQKTVESLANRISVTNTDIEIERCFLLQVCYPFHAHFSAALHFNRFVRSN